jgi:hypothetical protein
MRPDDVREQLDRRPFRRFRIYLDDGTSFEIMHPEQVLVTRSELVIGITERDGAKVFDRTVFAALSNATRLEPEPRPLE